MQQQRTPIVSDSVHYVSHGTPPRGDGTQAYTSTCRAAIVADVPTQVDPPGAVALCVLNPTGLFFKTALHDPGEADTGTGCAGREFEGGTWHWPDATKEPA